ncbi:hypothetical protein Tco_0642520 [Tanacetum coccineum]
MSKYSTFNSFALAFSSTSGYPFLLALPSSGLLFWDSSGHLGHIVIVSPRLFCLGLKVYHLPPASSEQDDLPSSTGLDFRAQRDDSQMARPSNNTQESSAFLSRSLPPANWSMVHLVVGLTWSFGLGAKDRCHSEGLFGSFAVLPVGKN